MAPIDARFRRAALHQTAESIIRKTGKKEHVWPDLVRYPRPDLVNGAENPCQTGGFIAQTRPSKNTAVFAVLSPRKFGDEHVRVGNPPNADQNLIGMRRKFGYTVRIFSHPHLQLFRRNPEQNEEGEEGRLSELRCQANGPD